MHPGPMISTVGKWAKRRGTYELSVIHVGHGYETGLSRIIALESQPREEGR